MTTTPGAPEHCNKQITGQCTSFCSMDNVQFYTLSPAQGKDPVYAIVVITAVNGPEDNKTYMMDKVCKVEDKSKIPHILYHLKKLSWSLRSHQGNDLSPNAKTRRFSIDSPVTPYSAKKTRRLSECPTDSSMQNPDEAMQSPASPA